MSCTRADGVGQRPCESSARRTWPPGSLLVCCCHLWHRCWRAAAFRRRIFGLLLAIASLAIVAAGPIWGHVADVVLGRRRTLQWAILLAAVAALLLGQPLALPLVGAALAAWYMLQTAFSTLLDSIAMFALGIERHRYGHLRLLQSLSYAVAAFVVGILYDRTGYRAAGIVFPVTAVALVLLLQAVRDPPRTELGTPAVVAATRQGGPQPGNFTDTVQPHHQVGRSVPGLGSSRAALQRRPAWWARSQQSCWRVLGYLPRTPSCRCACTTWALRLPRLRCRRLRRPSSRFRSCCRAGAWWEGLGSVACSPWAA